MFLEASNGDKITGMGAVVCLQVSSHSFAFSKRKLYLVRSSVIALINFIRLNLWRINERMDLEVVHNDVIEFELNVYHMTGNIGKN